MKSLSQQIVEANGGCWHEFADYNWIDECHWCGLRCSVDSVKNPDYESDIVLALKGKE